MVQYVLSFKATLEGVASIQCWSNKQLLCCDVRHPVDPTDGKERIVVDFSELEEPEQDEHHNHHHHQQKHHHAKKPFHFQVHWSDGTQGTIRVLNNNNNPQAADKKKKKTAARSQEVPPPALLSSGVTVPHPTSGAWFPVLTLDCDNVEPVRFHAMGQHELAVTNHHGTVYENIDLSSSGDWSAYDLAAGSTSVTNFESKFE